MTVPADAQAYAFAVHGGPEEAAAAGCIVPPPEQMPEHRDFKLFNVYCGLLRRLLASNDIDKVSPRGALDERLCGFRCVDTELIQIPWFGPGPGSCIWPASALTLNPVCRLSMALTLTV